MVQLQSSALDTNVALFAMALDAKVKEANQDHIFTVKGLDELSGFATAWLLIATLQVPYLEHAEAPVGLADIPRFIKELGAGPFIPGVLVLAAIGACFLVRWLLLRARSITIDQETLVYHFLGGRMVCRGTSVRVDRTKRAAYLLDGSFSGLYSIGSMRRRRPVRVAFREWSGPAALEEALLNMQSNASAHDSERHG